MSRSTLACLSLLTLACLHLLVLGCAQNVTLAAADPALELHRSAIVIDGHSDTTPWLEDPEWSFAERHEQGHEDLPRMREGGLDAQDRLADGAARALGLAQVDREELRVQAALAHARQILVPLLVTLREAPLRVFEPGRRVRVTVDHDRAAVQLEGRIRSDSRDALRTAEGQQRQGRECRARHLSCRRA